MRALSESLAAAERRKALALEADAQGRLLVAGESRPRRDHQSREAAAGGASGSKGHTTTAHGAGEAASSSGSAGSSSSYTDSEAEGHGGALATPHSKLSAKAAKEKRRLRRARKLAKTANADATDFQGGLTKIQRRQLLEQSESQQAKQDAVHHRAQQQLHLGRETGADAGGGAAAAGRGRRKDFRKELMELFVVTRPGGTIDQGLYNMHKMDSNQATEHILTDARLTYSDKTFIIDNYMVEGFFAAIPELGVDKYDIFRSTVSNTMRLLQARSRPEPASLQLAAPRRPRTRSGSRLRQPA